MRRNRLSPLIEAIPTKMHDEKRPGDVLKVPGDPRDDLADDARYGIYTFVILTEKPPELTIRDQVRQWRISKTRLQRRSATRTCTSAP